MGDLYDLASKITQRLEAESSGDMMALLRAKGQLATRVGFIVSFIAKSDPDDPVKIGKLRQVADELGILL